MSRVAAGVAAVCAIGAVATVAVMVKGGPSSLMQRGIVQMRPVRGMVPMQAVGQRKGEEPVYYVPMKKVKSRGSKASPLQLATKQQPVVYYYMPETKAAMHSVHHQMLANDTGNATAGGGDDAKLVCTVDNIKALSATVQTKWDACKAHADYKEPNKGASRRLLGWVWEPSAGEAKTAVPKHVPGFYRHQMLANDTAGNDTAAAGGGGDGPSFDDCQKEAAKEACASIASCEDPVCDNYYNEPEIEALCGMCTMAPLGCFAHSAEVYIQDKGAVKVGDLRIGDRVLAASTDGKPISSEVIFMHDHRDASTTVQIYVAEDMMELTPAHMVAIHTEACGLGYCSDAELVPAKEIRAGDKIYVSDGASTGVQTVNAVTRPSRRCAMWSHPTTRWSSTGLWHRSFPPEPMAWRLFLSTSSTSSPTARCSGGPLRRRSRSSWSLPPYALLRRLSTPWPASSLCRLPRLLLACLPPPRCLIRGICVDLIGCEISK